MHLRSTTLTLTLLGLLGCALLAAADARAEGEVLEDFAEGLEPVIPASFLDQPPAVNEPAAPAPARRRVYRGTRSQLIGSGSPIERLASTPHMFGDNLSLAGQVMVSNTLGPELSLLDLPLAGGTRRLKVSENNLPIPLDRVHYTYSHFSNAIGGTVQAGATTLSEGDPIDRHIVGVEKTFLGGWASLDIRMPFTGGVDTTLPGGLSATTGSVGNLSFITKFLLSVSDRTAFAAGLGIELPTGDDVTGGDATGRYILKNDAVHLLPYVAVLVVPNESWFFQGYAQLDAAANGNQVLLGPAAGTLVDLGNLTEQNLLHLDLAGGAWLHSDFDAPLITGIAAIVELHYVTTVSDPGEGPDIVTGYTAANREWQFGNQYGRVDLLQLTAGMHFELRQQTTLRVGAVVPLRAEPDRFFDSEVQVSLNHFW